MRPAAAPVCIDDLVARKQVKKGNKFAYALLFHLYLIEYFTTAQFTFQIFQSSLMPIIALTALD